MAERAFGIKIGDNGGVFASVIFPCTIKSRIWQAVMQEVCKRGSEFCITVRDQESSWLKEVAVNLSQPSGRLVVCRLNWF